MDVSKAILLEIRRVDISFFSGHKADQARHDFIVTNKAKSGEKFKFYIEAACNGMFGVGANDAMVADPNRYFSLSRADLVVANEPIQKLYHDLS